MKEEQKKYIEKAKQILNGTYKKTKKKSSSIEITRNSIIVQKILNKK